MYGVAACFCLKVGTNDRLQFYSRFSIDRTSGKLRRIKITLGIRAYYDRNARTAGMQEDLALGDRYAWLLTMFYISYILFEWLVLMWYVKLNSGYLVLSTIHVDCA